MLRNIRRTARQVKEAFRFYGKGRLRGRYTPRRMDLLVGTWNGDYDILGIMLLKVEHMFWKLKRHGCHMWSYLDSDTFLEGADEKYILSEFRKIINTKDKETIEYYNELPFGKCLKRFFVGKKDGVNCWLQHMDYNTEKTWYFCDEEKNWEKVDINKLWPYNSHDDFIIKGVIEQWGVVEIPPERYRYLSKETRSKMRGQRQTLVELLELRHTIKTLMELDDMNDKYYNMWSGESDDETRCEKLHEAAKVYQQDRLALYGKLAKIMAEKGDTWWD